MKLRKLFNKKNKRNNKDIEIIKEPETTEITETKEDKKKKEEKVDTRETENKNTADLENIKIKDNENNKNIETVESDNDKNDKNKEKKANKRKMIALVGTTAALVGTLSCVQYKPTLEKAEFYENYKYTLNQETEKFTVKYKTKYIKDDETYYRYEYTPKGNISESFTIDSTIKPKAKTVTGAKYTYTISYPGYSQIKPKNYSYYQTEYGNSVSDYEIKQFNSYRYIEEYYAENFKNPVEKMDLNDSIETIKSQQAKLSI